MFDEPLLSSSSSHGLVLWAALKAWWALRCETRYRGTTPSLDDFVAKWVGDMEAWRAERDLSLSKVDLQHLTARLLSWFEGGMLQQRQPAPGVFPAQRAAAPGNAKERKWGVYRDPRNAVHTVRTQCKLCYVGNYLNPSFGLFSSVGCSKTDCFTLLVDGGCGTFELPPIFTHLQPF